MLIPLGYSQVNLRFTGTGLPHGAEVSFGVNQNDATQTPAVIADNVGQAYVENLLSVCANQVKLTEILVKSGPNDEGPSAVVAMDLTGVANYGDVIPSNTLLVRKNTAMGGRRGRGRNFWPLIGESAVGNGGFIQGETLALFQQRFDFFLQKLQGLDMPMVLLHGEQTKPTPPLYITGLSVQPQIASQRRRLRG